MKNTFNNGQVKVLVYRERDADIWYASALEFNLTIDGTDKSAVLIELQQAIHDYIVSAREIGDVSLLNQEPDPELTELWNINVLSQVPQDATPSPYVTTFAGIEKLSFA